MQIDRAPLGIDAFDSLIEGGLPRSSLILLAGEPGSGKTILASEFLYAGLSKFKEPAVYVSLAEDRGLYIREMERLGMDFGRYEKQGTFKFLELLSMKEEGVKILTQEILAAVEKYQPKRIVIDSVTALLLPLKVDEQRVMLHTVLSRICRSSGVTAILLSEKPLNSGGLGSQMEEFVVDGVLLMTHKFTGGKRMRTIQISKMRGTNVSNNEVHYTITERGIVPIPRPLLKVADVSYTERLSSGIEGFDSMLGGGVFKGSVTLVAGAAGTGKTCAGIQFIADGLRLNERCLHISFEEPPSQLIRQAEAFGLPYRRSLKSQQLMLIYCDPHRDSLDEFFYATHEAMYQHKGSRLLLDGISAAEHFFNAEDYYEFLSTTTANAKADGVTTFLTSTTRSNVAKGGDFDFSETRISAIVDNIVLLRHVELLAKLMLVLNVVKERGSAHDNALREYRITNKGIVLGQSLAGFEGLTSGVARRIAQNLDSVIERIDAVIPPGEGKRRSGT